MRYYKDVASVEENLAEEFTATFSMRDWAGEHKTTVTITGTVAAIAIAGVAMTAYYLRHHHKAK